MPLARTWFSIASSGFDLGNDRSRSLRHRLPQTADCAGDAVEGAANDAADRRRHEVEHQQGRERPTRQAMQGPGGGDRLAGHAGCDVTAGKGGDDPGKHVPEAGDDREGGDGRIVAGAGIERRDADADAQHRQENLDDKADDDAGEDRSPGDPVDQDRVGVLPGGRPIVGLGAREARCS